jgi:putative transposase
MKQSRFSDEQKIAILKEVRAGATVVTCAKHNIGVQTYHGRKRKLGGMEVDEARRLRALEEECGRLKRVVADQAGGSERGRSSLLTQLPFPVNGWAMSRPLRVEYEGAIYHLLSRGERRAAAHTDRHSAREKWPRRSSMPAALTPIPSA